MNFRIITKNLAPDSKIGSPLKIDFRADLTHEPIPTAWELIVKISEFNFFTSKSFLVNENIQEIF